MSVIYAQNVNQINFMKKVDVYKNVRLDMNQLKILLMII